MSDVRTASTVSQCRIKQGRPDRAGIKNGVFMRMRRIERMQRIRSPWREGTSMLTQKALGSWRKDSLACTNDPPNPPNPHHPLGPSVLDARP